MDSRLSEYFNKYNITYIKHRHPAFFTVEEAKPYEKDFTFTRSKNLFLTDKQGNFFLYCLPADKKAPLKELKRALDIKELRFASESDLFEQLGLKPGHVSIFALVRNRNIHLILDKELWDAKTLGFHPNVNTATLELTHENFVKFYNSLENKKEVIELA